MKRVFMNQIRPFKSNGRIVLIFCVLSLASLFYSASSQTYISLDECRKRAIEQNYLVKSAQMQADAAKSLSKAAFTNFLPNASINGTYTRLNRDIKLFGEDQFLPIVPYTALTQEGKINPAAFQDPSIAPTFLAFNPVTHQPLMDASGHPVFKEYAWMPASAMTFDFRNVWMVNAGIVQPIFTGGKVLETWKMAKVNHQIALSARNYQVSDVLYNTEYYYWTLVSVREKVILARKYLSLLEQLSQDVNNYYAEGIITKTDVLKVEVKREDAELQLLKAQNGEKLASMALCRITGLPLNSDLVPSDSLSISPILPVADSLVQTAYLQRPELMILKNTVDLAHHNTGLMRSRFMPNLGLTVNSVWLNPNPFDGLSHNFGQDVNIGVVFNVPVFHWGERYNTLKAAHLQEEAARNQYDEAASMVNLEIHQLWFSWKEAVKKASIADRNFQQAEENMKLCTDKFHEGMLKVTDLLEAQLLYQQAWSEKIEAQTECKLSEIKLAKATGLLTAETASK